MKKIWFPIGNKTRTIKGPIQYVCDTVRMSKPLDIDAADNWRVLKLFPFSIFRADSFFYDFGTKSSTYYADSRKRRVRLNPELIELCTISWRLCPAPFYELFSHTEYIFKRHC